ncbi:hypothetical protein [Acinetobacter calcoaceticus]
MPHITSILGNEPGIQYQGVTDKTGSTGSAPINNIFIGKFKRGRLDRPMTITKTNIRGMLGYDPKNLDYVAVQDALDTNIPSIQVMRIAKLDEPPISCAGATPSIYFPTFNGIWNIEVDGILFKNTLNDSLAHFINSTEGLKEKLSGFEDEFLEIVNKLERDVRVKLIPIMNNSYAYPERNPTFMVANAENELTFCLSAAGV